jgi:hypothetical protein
MSDTKIKDLTGKTTVASTDEIVINDVAGGDADKKENMGDVKTFMSDSPELVTPDLGTPSAGVLANCTGLPTSGLEDASDFVLTTQANTYGDFLQTIKDDKLKINSPDDADGVTIVNSDQTAERNLTIPVLTADDTIPTLGLAQTFSQIQTMLGLEITGGTTLQKINKRAVFPFTGKLLDVTHYWTLSDVTGSGGTAVIQDGIDGGVRITTPASASAKTSLTQNDVRHWNPANCIFWGIGKYQNVTVSMHQGISDNNNSANGNGVWFNINTDTSFMILLGREAGSGLAVNTDVSTNVSDPVPYKIICSATNQKLYLLVGGVWTLKATQSTKLPTAACQPHFQAVTSNSDANWVEIIYMELVNLTN